MSFHIFKSPQSPAAGPKKKTRRRRKTDDRLSSVGGGGEGITNWKSKGKRLLLLLLLRLRLLQGPLRTYHFAALHSLRESLQVETIPKKASSKAARLTNNAMGNVQGQCNDDDGLLF